MTNKAYQTSFASLYIDRFSLLANLHNVLVDYKFIHRNLFPFTNKIISYYVPKNADVFYGNNSVEFGSKRVATHGCK